MPPKKSPATPKAAAAKAATKKAAPKKAPAPVPVATAEPAAHARKNLVDVLDMHIPPARCDTHQKAAINENPEELAALRQQKADAKAKGNAKEEERLKGLISEITKNQPRVGRVNQIAIAAFSEKVAGDLLRHCYTQAAGEGSTQADLYALMDSSPVPAAALALIRALPSYKNWTQEEEEEIRKQITEESKAEKAEREERKRLREEGKEVPKKERKEGDARPPTSFITYVDKIKDEIAKSAEFSESVTRCSKRLRMFVSDLIVEFIHHITVLARNMIQKLDIHTLNENHTMIIVETLMHHEGVSEAEFNDYFSFVEMKLNAFNEHLESEKARKEAEMSDERRQELAEKKAAHDAEQKKKKYDNLVARAKESALEAKKLEAEIKAA